MGEKLVFACAWKRCEKVKKGTVGNASKVNSTLMPGKVLLPSEPPGAFRADKLKGRSVYILAGLQSETVVTGETRCGLKTAMTGCAMVHATSEDNR